MKWYATGCPRCGAGAYEPCIDFRTTEGWRAHPHDERVKAALRKQRRARKRRSATPITIIKDGRRETISARELKRRTRR